MVVVVKNLPANAGNVQSLGWEDSWKKTRQPTPVLLPGESHGQRGLAGYSSNNLIGLKQLCMHTCTCFFLTKGIREPAVNIP